MTTKANPSTEAKVVSPQPGFPSRIDAQAIIAAAPSSKPDFLGVGTSKCGTTWVWNLLAEHPEIGSPENPVAPGKKEFNFWNDYRNEITTAQYLDAFRACSGKMKGEYSPDYINSTECLRRIRYCLPDVKIICGFRNPVNLFHSSYFHMLRNGGDYQEFGDWFPGYIDSMFEHFNFDRILRDLKIFPESNVFTYIFEEAVADPVRFARNLFGFLGVDTDFLPRVLNTPVNVRYQYRSRRLHLLLATALIWRYGKDKGRWLINSPHLRPFWLHAILRLNQKNASGFSPDPADAELVREKTLPFVKEFLDRYNKWDDWGYRRS